MTGPVRRPATFRLDDPRLVVAPQKPASATIESDTTIAEAPSELVPAPPMRAMRRVPWGTLFWSAGSGLVLLGLGWAVATFVEE